MLSKFERSCVLIAAAAISSAALGSPLFDNTNANFWRVNPDTGQIDSYSVLGNQWLENFLNSQGQPIYVLTNPYVGLVNQLANSSVPLQSQSNGTYLPVVSIAGLGVADYGDIQAPVVNSFHIYPDGGAYTGTIQVSIDIDGELFSDNRSLELAWGTGSTTNRKTFSESDINSEGVARVSFYFAQATTHALKATLTDITNSQHVDLGTKFQTYIINVADQENRADVDKDGLPDIVEVAIGLNPFEKDWNHDSNGDGWSDFDVWLRNIDPKYLDSQGIPRDTDNDGWSDFDEEQLRNTNHKDLVTSLPSNPGNVEFDTTAYTNALNRYQDVPSATSLYEVEYDLSAGVTNIEVPLNGASAIRTRSEIRTTRGGSAFELANLLTEDELSELTAKQRDQIPLRLVLSHLEQSIDVGDIRNLRISAGDSLIFSVDETRRFPDVNDEPSSDNKTYRLKTWIPERGSLSPLTFDSQSEEWESAEEWRTAFIEYLNNNLVVTENISVGLDETISTAFIEYLVAQEMGLLSVDESFVFNSLREQTPTLDYMESQLVLLHQSSLSNAVARIDSLRTTQLSYQFGIAADYLNALPGNHVSDEYLQQQLLNSFALDSDEGYQIRLMLLENVIDELAADNTITDANEDSDNDSLSNMQEVMQLVTSMTAPWSDDTDDDNYGDENDPCVLDPTNLCDPNTPVLMVDGSLQARESGDEGNGYLVLTLQLNAPASDVVTLDYAVASLEGDTAQLNIDYTAVSDTATFMPGQQAVVIQIPLNSDTEVENTEGFHLVLSNPQGVTLQTDTYELGILDEDTVVLSGDASLANISGVTLSPDFNGSVFSYTATIPADQTQVQLSATTNDDGATLTLNGGQVVSGLTYTLPMSEGENPATYQVQSEDGDNTLTYQITITREEPMSPYFELSELDGNNGDWINGTEDNQNLGLEIAPLGDFNGDGYDDFAVASPAKFDSGNFVGEFYVAFGRSSGLDLTTPINQLMNGSDGFKVYTSSVSPLDTRLGSVISSGDFNNDGLNDILVSAPRYGGTAIGRVIVIYGKSNWSAVDFDVETMTSSDGFYFNGVYRADYRAGLSSNALRAGDLNGDGIDDIFMFSSFSEGSGAIGRIYVAFGKESWGAVEQDIETLIGSNGFQISGISSNDTINIGRTGGDINNDGFDDLVIKGYRRSGSTVSSLLYLFYGSNTLTNKTNAEADITFLKGDNTSSSFGYDFGGEFDFNQDGYDDLLIGSPAEDGGAGAAYLIYGREFDSESFDVNDMTSQEGFMIGAEFPGDALSATSITDVGDFNGDGFDELFLGIYRQGDQEQDRARGYLIFGTDQTFSQPLNLSVLGADKGIAFRGGNYSAVANIFAAGLGDFNGDGFDDLGITFPRESADGGSNNGQVNVIYGFTNFRAQ